MPELQQTLSKYSLPAGTSILIILCVLIFIQSWLPFMHPQTSQLDQVHDVCLDISSMAERWQCTFRQETSRRRNSSSNSEYGYYAVYRIYLYSFMHVAPLHLILNAVSMAGLGRTAEREWGTVAFLVLIFSIIWLSSMIHFVVGLALSSVPALSFLYSQCTIGISGVLFALIVLETRKSLGGSMSLFGLVSVPTRVYPFVLIILIQILVPNASLLGHLAGAFTGLLISMGGEGLIRPGYVKWTEKKVSPFLSRRLPGFVAHDDVLPYQPIGDRLLPDTPAQMPLSPLLASPSGPTIKNGIISSKPASHHLGGGR